MDKADLPPLESPCPRGGKEAVALCLEPTDRRLGLWPKSRQVFQTPHT